MPAKQDIIKRMIDDAHTNIGPEFNYLSIPNCYQVIVYHDDNSTRNLGVSQQNKEIRLYMSHGNPVFINFITLSNEEIIIPWIKVVNIQ